LSVNEMSSKSCTTRFWPPCDKFFSKNEYNSIVNINLVLAKMYSMNKVRIPTTDFSKEFFYQLKLCFTIRIWTKWSSSVYKTQTRRPKMSSNQ